MSVTAPTPTLQRAIADYLRSLPAVWSALPGGIWIDLPIKAVAPDAYDREGRLLPCALVTAGGLDQSTIADGWLRLVQVYVYQSAGTGREAIEAGLGAIVPALDMRQAGPVFRCGWLGAGVPLLFVGTLGLAPADPSLKAEVDVARFEAATVIGGML